MSESREIIVKGILEKDSPGYKAIQVYIKYEVAREIAQIIDEANRNYKFNMSESIIGAKFNIENDANENPGFWPNIIGEFKIGAAATIATLIGGPTATFALAAVTIADQLTKKMYTSICDALATDRSQDFCIKNLVFPTQQVFDENHNVLEPSGPLSEDKFKKLQSAYDDICAYIEDKKRREWWKCLGFRSFNPTEVSDPKYMAAILLANKIKSIMGSASVGEAHFHLQHFSNILDSFMTDETILYTKSTDYYYKSLQTVIFNISKDFSLTVNTIMEKDLKAEFKFDPSNDLKELNSNCNDVIKIHDQLLNDMSQYIKAMNDNSVKDNNNFLIKSCNYLINCLNDLKLNYNIVTVDNLNDFKSQINAFQTELLIFENAKTQYIQAAFDDFNNLSPKARTLVLQFVNFQRSSLKELCELLINIDGHISTIERHTPKNDDKEIITNIITQEPSSHNKMAKIAVALEDQTELLRSCIEINIQKDTFGEMEKNAANNIIQEGRENDESKQGWWWNILYAPVNYFYGTEKSKKIVVNEPINDQDNINIPKTTDSVSSKETSNSNMVSAEDYAKLLEEMSRIKEENLMLKHLLNESTKGKLLNEINYFIGVIKERRDGIFGDKSRELKMKHIALLQAKDSLNDETKLNNLLNFIQTHEKHYGAESPTGLLVTRTVLFLTEKNPGHYNEKSFSL